MSYCTDCIHYNVCGNEGFDDVAMTFCADKRTDGVSQSVVDQIKWERDIAADKSLIIEIDKLPRIKVGNSNSPTVKYCIDEVLLYDLLERYKAEKTAEVRPMQVELIGDGYADGELVYDSGKCPTCGWEFESGDKDWKEPYCCHCGQKLKWFESEE